MLYLNLFEILRKVRSKPFALSIICLVIYEGWYKITKGIVTPLSLTIDDIGKKTKHIETEIGKIWDELPEVLGAPQLPRTTGEENGLL
jgi:hypothetical protein